MSEWQIKTLAEMCEMITVGHVGSMASQYAETGVPFLRSQNVRPGRLDMAGLKFISENFHRQLRKSQLRTGDVVIVRTGEPGAAALIPEDMGELNCSDLVIARPAKSVDPRFLCYSINATARQYVAAHLVGAVQQHFNVGSARNMRLAAPPLPQQRAIADVLAALDDKIAVNERIAGMYESLLRLRFEELLIDVEPTLGCEVVLSDLVELNPRTSTPFADDAVYLDMASVPIDAARVQEWSRRAPKSGTRFENGDTVMARITPCLENGKTAFIDFMANNEVGVGSTEFIVLRAKKGVPIHIPYFLARSPRFRAYAIQNMVGSSGRQRVSAAALGGFTLARPDAEEMAAFGEEASAVFAHMKSLDAESRLVRDLRDSLLPKLMSGELRVRDAEKAVEDVT